MSRSRKVEPEAAVNAAMALFWTHGFAGLGTRQIEEETGITRFTLQTTYGGKMKLYQTALDAYLDSFENSDLMNNVEGDLESIATFFEMRGNSNAMPNIASQGCFMLNSMIEFSSSDPEINLRADRYFRMLRQWFGSALERSRENGSLHLDLHIREMTEILLSTALGLNTIIRAKGNHGAGEKMAVSIARMVRTWGPSEILPT